MISKICPKFQVLSSDFSEVCELLGEKIEQKLCEVNTNDVTNLCPIRYYVSIKGCCQEFWYILSGVDNQLEQSYNHNPARKKNWFKVVICNESYTNCFCRLILSHSLGAKASRNKSDNMGSIAAVCPQGAEAL